MIDKTAIIDPKAKLSKNVDIGPYCVIGPNVEIGEDTIIQSHVNISGNVKIGKGNKIYPFGKDGGKELSNKLDVPFIGEIPLLEDITVSSEGSNLFAFKEKLTKLKTLRDCLKHNRDIDEVIFKEAEAAINDIRNKTNSEIKEITSELVQKLTKTILNSN